jgi:hypothetical protein
MKVCFSLYSVQKRLVFLTPALLAFLASQFFVVQAVLCIVGCLTTFLTSTHWMLVTASYPLTLQNIARCPLGQNLISIKNHSSRLTVKFN